MNDSRAPGARDDESVDLALLLRAIRRRLPLVGLVVIFAAGAAVGLSLLQEKQYSASASLLFRDPALDEKLFGSSIQAQTDPDRQAATNLDLVSLDAVAAATAQRLGRRWTQDQVSEKVEVSSGPESDVASITATDPDPRLAATLANAFADQYVQFRRDADRAKVREAYDLVERELERLRQTAPGSGRIRALEARAEDLRVLTSLQTGNAELVQQATAASSPSSPKPVRNGLFGAFGGVILGLALAVLLERLDRRLKRPEDVEEAFGLPLIGQIPKSATLGGSSTRKLELPPAEAASFQLLRANLRYFGAHKELKSLLVTSATPQDGKSTVALHLARAAAETGEDVLLLEADLRRPSLARELSLPGGKGLSTVLGRRYSSLADVGHHVRSERHIGDGPMSLAEFDVVCTGPTPPNPTELMGSKHMADVIEEAEADYDLVIVDTPPITVVADAVPLVSLVSGVIVVSRIGLDTRDSSKRLREQLDRLGARTLGVVANFAPKTESSYYEYSAVRAPVIKTR